MVRKCIICGKVLIDKQDKYCSQKCRLIGLNHSKRRGRKGILNDALIEEICNYIRAGNYIEDACGACGIGVSTFYQWKDRAEKEGHPLYCKFLEAVKLAKAQRIASLIIEIRKDNSWQSKAWIAERIEPKKWGKKETLALEEETPKNIKVTIIKGEEE